MYIIFPVLAIKGVDAVAGGIVQAADIDAQPLGVWARNIKGFDSTNFTKMMLGNACTKGVCAKLRFTLKQGKRFFIHNIV